MLLEPFPDLEPEPEPEPFPDLPPTCSGHSTMYSTSDFPPFPDLAEPFPDLAEPFPDLAVPLKEKALPDLPLCKSLYSLGGGGV
jgi:hypothetical protein